MKSVSVLAVLLATGTASAEPRHYAQTGAMAGLGREVTIDAVGSLELGYRLDNGLWLRGGGNYGYATDEDGDGKRAQLRAGAEVRSCTTSNIACAVFVGDVAGEHRTWQSFDNMQFSSNALSLLVIPRVGVDVGGRQLRANLGLEMPIALASEEFTSDWFKYERKRMTGVRGLELSAGVAYQW